MRGVSVVLCDAHDFQSYTTGRRRREGSENFVTSQVVFLSCLAQILAQFQKHDMPPTSYMPASAQCIVVFGVVPVDPRYY